MNTIKCPYCGSDKFKKNGHQKKTQIDEQQTDEQQNLGKQRYMCKGCKRTFQESFTRVKRTYNIERFLCTLYKLINDEEEIVKFSDEEIIDEISNYLKDRPYNNIVIKKIKNISNATNIIVESYDLKFVAIFMAENEVQIHKFNTRNENGKYIINLINNKAKRYDCLATI